MQQLYSTTLLALSSSKARFLAIAIFLLIVFFAGGSSRPDSMSLILLRPLSVLFSVYALLLLKSNQLRNLGWPPIFLMILAALILFQLIPLPPSLWLQLPARKLIADIGELMNVGPVWRPLSIAPTATWNSLFSLTIPIAVILLYAIQDRANRPKILVLFIIIGVASAFWSLMQVLGPQRGPLYLHKITNNGSAVGFFANRNHHAVFQACIILVSGWYFYSINPRHKLAMVKASVSIGTMLLLVPLIFIIGSRAGLVAGTLAVCGAFIFIYRSPILPSKISLGRKRELSSIWLLNGLAGLVIALVALVIFRSRSQALDRLIASDNLHNLRTELLPVFADMIRDSFPFGYGFGTFQYTYKIYEPLELLSYQYLNQAHNDWAQWAIEGGAPAVLLLLFFIGWFVVRLIHALRSHNPHRQSYSLLAAGIILIYAGAAATDYALRVPSTMAFITILCLMLGEASPKKRNSAKA